MSERIPSSSHETERKQEYSTPEELIHGLADEREALASRYGSLKDTDDRKRLHLEPANLRETRQEELGAAKQELDAFDEHFGELGGNEYLAAKEAVDNLGLASQVDLVVAREALKDAEQKFFENYQASLETSSEEPEETGIDASETEVPFGPKTEAQSLKDEIDDLTKQHNEKYAELRKPGELSAKDEAFLEQKLSEINAKKKELSELQSALERPTEDEKSPESVKDKTVFGGAAEPLNEEAEPTDSDDLEATRALLAEVDEILDDKDVDPTVHSDDVAEARNLLNGVDEILGEDDTAESQAEVKAREVAALEEFYKDPEGEGRKLLGEFKEAQNHLVDVMARRSGNLFRKKASQEDVEEARKDYNEKFIAFYQKIEEIRSTVDPNRTDEERNEDAIRLTLLHYKGTRRLINKRTEEVTGTHVKRGWLSGLATKFGKHNLAGRLDKSNTEVQELSDEEKEQLVEQINNLGEGEDAYRVAAVETANQERIDNIAEENRRSAKRRLFGKAAVATAVVGGVYVAYQAGSNILENANEVDNSGPDSIPSEVTQDDVEGAREDGENGDTDSPEDDDVAEQDNDNETEPSWEAPDNYTVANGAGWHQVFEGLGIDEKYYDALLYDGDMLNDLYDQGVAYYNPDLPGPSSWGVAKPGNLPAEALETIERAMERHQQ